MSLQIPQNGWNDFFKKHKKDLRIITSELLEAEETHNRLKFFPPKNQIFRAFELIAKKDAGMYIYNFLLILYIFKYFSIPIKGFRWITSLKDSVSY